MTRPRLRVPWQRGSTGHVCSIYPWSVHDLVLQQGPAIGVDMLSGGLWCWDPFEAHAAGLVSNPNVAVFGIPGQRKSTLIKTFLARMFTLYDTQRWVAIADPKGEYVTLAEHLGLAVISLSPGGSSRINPIGPSPLTSKEDPTKAMMRRADTSRDLVASVLRRDLSPAEETLLGAAVAIAIEAAAEATLADVAALLADPTAELAAQMRSDVAQVAADGTDLYYGLQSLVNQSLAGMFDGPSTVTLPADGRGVVLDLSGLDIGSRAMPLVLMAATAWLQDAFTIPGPQRIQVLDELWLGAGDERFIRHVQRCQKLGRTWGVANIHIGHKVTDAAAQADDGSAESKIAAGLLADAATKIILRQDADQLDIAQHAFGLTTTERSWIGSLVSGRALWLLGDHRGVVQHHLAAHERHLVDTDQRMRDIPAGSPPMRRRLGLRLLVVRPPNVNVDGRSN